MTTQNALEIKNLSKSYGPHFSLKEVNLLIEKGEVFALVGQNGAGKTTLVKLILDLLRSDQGEVKIFGELSQQKISRQKVGFIPEKFSFFSFYTVEGVLEFFADCRGLQGEVKKQQIENALNKLSLIEIRNRKLSTFSKGQVQRVGLASLLIGELDLLILDEPFSGLDPIGIKDLKELIREFKQTGKTVFINSHILLEMEQLCDSCAILKEGKLVHTGKINQFKEMGTTFEEFFTKKIMEK